jgi:hypothetical protein
LLDDLNAKYEGLDMVVCLNFFPVMTSCFLSTSRSLVFIAASMTSCTFFRCLFFVFEDMNTFPTSHGCEIDVVDAGGFPIMMLSSLQTSCIAADFNLHVFTVQGKVDCHGVRNIMEHSQIDDEFREHSHEPPSVKLLVHSSRLREHHITGPKNLLP